MPDDKRGPIEDLLHEVWRDVARLDEGEIATYIPELAKADPSICGIGLATLDGHVYVAGELVPFTIQSVSKPFVYALALADRGADVVLQKVGVEPTGDAFNSISIDDASGRAHNPMVNAGAIVTASLVGGSTRACQLERLIEGLSAFAGRQLEVDEQVFASERDTGDRNRAIAYLMRSAGLLEDDVEEAVALYFRQCSVLVTARDLAVMAATLANRGTNPVTGHQVVPAEVVAPVLTVMATCGMYDYAGEWLYRVGLPAKSGVSGGVAAALPGQLGLGVHSPPLDARGNSVRGVAAAELLSSRLGLHLLLPTEPTGSGLRRSYRADVVGSRRGRPQAQRELLAASGSAIAVHELTGDLGFARAEALVRLVLDDATETHWRVLDLRRVTRIDTAAVALLRRLIEQLVAGQVGVAIVEPRSAPARLVAGELGEDVQRFTDLDSALERCETQLLARRGVSDELPEGLVSLADQDLLVGFSAHAIASIQSRTTSRVFTPGTVIFNEGADPDGLYFVAAGQVSVDVRTRRAPGRRRLNTITAGSAFGELALVDGRTRSTRISAVEPTICQVLGPEAFAGLRLDEPEVWGALTLAIACSLSERLRHSTADVAAFEEG